MLICKRKRSHYVSASFVTVNDAPFKKSIHKKVRIGYKYPLLALFLCGDKRSDRTGKLRNGHGLKPYMSGTA